MKVATSTGSSSDKTMPLVVGLALHRSDVAAPVPGRPETEAARLGRPARSASRLAISAAASGRLIAAEACRIRASASGCCRSQVRSATMSRGRGTLRPAPALTTNSALPCSWPGTQDVSKSGVAQQVGFRDRARSGLADDHVGATQPVSHVVHEALNGQPAVGSPGARRSNRRRRTALRPQMTATSNSSVRRRIAAARR